MSVTDYRRARSDSSGQPWMDSLRREVAAEVAEEMRALKKELSDLRSQIAGKKTDVHVTTPAVSVAAPNVSVSPAQVSAPVTVDVDLGDLQTSMASLETAVKALTVMLSKEVTKTVHRGSDNLINTITEKR